MSTCCRQQAHTAASRAWVELSQIRGVTGTVGDAAQQFHVHSADQRGELLGEPVERTVAQHDGAVLLLLPGLVPGVLQRCVQVAGLKGATS
jgi:hypothetical protein